MNSKITFRPFIVVVLLALAALLVRSELDALASRSAALAESESRDVVAVALSAVPLAAPLIWQWASSLGGR